MRHLRSDNGRAFLPDPYGRIGGHRAHSRNELADALAQEFLASATTTEDVTDTRDHVMFEEVGGPFSFSSPQVEFGSTVNEAAPPDGDRESVPVAVRQSPWDLLIVRQLGRTR